MRTLQEQLTDTDPDVDDLLPRLSVAVIVQFQVPLPDVWMVSPFGKLFAEPYHGVPNPPELEPERPAGPLMVYVTVPEDSSVTDALTCDSQTVWMPLPKVYWTHVTLGPSMPEITGGRSTVALTTSGTDWPPAPLKAIVAEGPEPSARLPRSSPIVIGVDDPGARVPDAGETVNGDAPLALQLTG